MQQRHKDRKQYFDEQVYTTEKYVIPFVNEFMPITKDMAILEIGCGEGGNMKPFLDIGCQVVGIDLNEGQIENAKVYFADHPNVNNLRLILRDIYKMKPNELGEFDLIIMRDVIEHIPNQEKFMGYVKQFLKPTGKFFLGFPPWYMPFGGHQQIMNHKYFSKLPYYHLLPMTLYKGVLNIVVKSDKVRNELIEIKETGISIERFRRIVKTENYKIDKEVMYLFNPNYDIKFGLNPKEQIGIVKAIPFFRNFLTTCCYYLISK
ncbi:MAG: class I SAM-dependent methyltransferase [Saprospiraceae bacterium]